MNGPGKLTNDMLLATRRRNAAPFPPQSPAGRYGFAVVCVAVAAGVAWLAAQLAGPFRPFLLFVPAVLLSGWYGGRGPGALATGLATAVVLLSSRFLEVSGRGSIGLFVLVGLLISFVVEIWHEEVRRVEEQVSVLAETLARQRALLGGLPGHAVFLLDPAGRIRDWDQAATRLTGYSDDDVRGRHLSCLFGPDEIRQGQPQSLLSSAVERGHSRREGWLVREDGTRFWASITVTVLDDSPQGMIGYSILIQDTTERKNVHDQLLRSEQQLRDLSTHLQSVREDERTRIALEIHDELGQSLTCLKMELAWLHNQLKQIRNNNGEGDPLVERARSLCGSTDEVIRKVRTLSNELRPQILDEFGLAAAMEWQAQEFEQRTGILCRFAAPLPEVALDGQRSTALFRILQEALTNVARHSGATRVEIQFRETPNELVLVVRDDGRGIGEHDLAGSRSLGLVGMRERAMALGGQVEISGAPGRGTTVHAWIPRAATGANGATNEPSDNRR